MTNNELFVLDPSDNNLMNDGVVNINTTHDLKGIRTIRHELKTFVCEGEYERGINLILSTYLKHIDDPKQPAAWVSGFFGSGKSHLIKMLKYYWENFEFESGETARTIKELPMSVREQLTELDRKQSIYGKLAISGTLKDFPSKDIRYSFLQLMLNALKLPQQYHLFKFVHWARSENIYDELKQTVEESGKDFNKELQSLFVSNLIASTVLKLKPDFASSEAEARSLFKAQFKRVEFLDRMQLLSTIKDEVLPLFFGDKIPCTIVILDEVQQFIGDDQSKTLDIQNLAQDVCDSFDGKFLLVGSGQNALSDTPQLSPLQDRFTVKVNLSDADVKKVTQKTVLAKKPSAIPAVEQQMESALGEISRNLHNSAFAYTNSDRSELTADYPLLPSIRRFWAKVIQVIDVAGTSGQLRSQLRIVDESVKRVAGLPLGHIVPGDFVFEQKQNQLLQNSILLNETNNLINERLAFRDTDPDKYLEGRVLSVVFLIGQLPEAMPGGKLKANNQTIADLLISDLTVSSQDFREQVDRAIKRLVDETMLMTVDDEYKLQTKIGTEWEQVFQSHVIRLNNSGQEELNRNRQEAFLKKMEAKAKGLNILHGTSRQKREFQLWDRAEKPSVQTKLHLWVRDGWNENEGVMLEEIRSEGSDTPLAYLYIPKQRDTELRGEIIKYIAAKRTLEEKGMQSSLEGQQAYRAMETRMKRAEIGLQDMADRVVEDARVYLAGGTPTDSGNLFDNIKEALLAIADRQFPEFKSKADLIGWDKALSRAISKQPDALRAVQHNGETKDHPAAAELLRYIGTSAKSGRDIRAHFMQSPYGWSQDAADALMIALTNAEVLSSTEADLRTGNINRAEFRKETHSLTAMEKITLRKLFQEAGIGCQPNMEFEASEEYLNQLLQLAAQVSGEPPLPKRIDTGFLKNIQHLTGNARLSEIHGLREKLKDHYTSWTARMELLTERQKNWVLAGQLRDSLPDGETKLREEYDAIRENRLIFQEPDPIAPLLQQMTGYLNNILNVLIKEYLEEYEMRMEELLTAEAFQYLDQKVKHRILSENQLIHKHEPRHLEAEKLANHLRKIPLDLWRTKISALQQQFDRAMQQAVQHSQPKAEFYALPRKTLKTKAEIQAYTDKLREELIALLDDAESITLQ